MHHLLRISILFLIFGLALPGLGSAESLPMVKRQPLFGDRAPLFSQSAGAGDVKTHNGSLFAGQGAGSLLAPYPARQGGSSRKAALTSARFSLPAVNVTPLGRLRHLIASAEAGSKGYDAVQYGATKKPPKPPSQMTVQEIYAWIQNTPGQPHAIGRYQFIPKTLKRLIKKSGTSPLATFDEALQDKLADILLAEAGVHEMMKGNMTRKAFMLNLAKIWAGFPTSTGRSYYAGVAGNKATMTWAHFDREMRRIFPG